MAISESAPSDTREPGLAMPPMVSVVIPCYNEERFIGKVLDKLAGQYDLNSYEIIVVDGLSNDDTRRVVAESEKSHPEISIKVIDNAKRTIPHALNLGVAAARGEIIARMDAHAVASENYIRGCVDVLLNGGAAVVGMPCRVRPAESTLMARAIAAAVSHPFGIGDATYRLGKKSSGQEAVDTVAFACFRKSLWQELGGFNEDLLTNEDYDFNYRVRQRGGQVILDHSGHCDYFARATLKGLARQYRRYGHWKARMVRLHPGSIKPRHMVAPLFVLSIPLLGLAGKWSSWAWWLLGLELALYAVLSVIFGFQVAPKSKRAAILALLMPVVFLTIHLTWGTNFLLGMFKRSQR